MLKKIFAALTLGLGLWSGGVVQAYNGNMEDVTMNLTVTRQVAPDLAYIHYSVFGNGAKPEQASGAAVAKEAAVKQALTEAGVAAADLLQENYNLYPVYGEQQKVTGYRVNNGLKIRVEELDRLGKLLTVLTGAGADSVSSVEYTLRDGSKYQDELLREAIVQAKAKAQVMAEAGERRLGRLLMVRLQNGSYNSRAGNAVMLAKSMAAGTDVALESRNIQIAADVEITFALQ